MTTTVFSPWKFYDQNYQDTIKQICGGHFSLQNGEGREKALNGSVIIQRKQNQKVISKGEKNLLFLNINLEVICKRDWVKVTYKAHAMNQV